MMGTFYLLLVPAPQSIPSANKAFPQKASYSSLKLPLGTPLVSRTFKRTNRVDHSTKPYLPHVVDCLLDHVRPCITHR